MTVPEPPAAPPTQTPLTAKQPVRTFMPLAKVDEAVVELTLSRPTFKPASNVEVAVVEVPRKEDPMMVLPRISPATERA